jgi:hypothetical protein
MRQSDRRKILLFLTLLFVIVGGAAIFYAQGYRLNISPLGLRKIGAIYVKSFPGNAEVFLEGRKVEKTNHFFGISFFFLQGGTLINGLFPKSYDLSLGAEGFKSWKQTLTVKPALVTEVKYAVLVPEAASLESTTSIAEFWTVGVNILSRSPLGSIKSNSSTLPGSKVLDENQDGRVLTSDQAGNLFESDLVNGRTVNVSALLTANGLNAGRFLKIALDQGGNGLLLLSERNAYVLNLDSGILISAEKISSSTAVFADAASSPSLIASSEYNALKNSSNIFVYDKSSRATSSYSIPLFGRTVQMDFKGNRLGLVQSDGSFFYGDPRSTNGLLKLASDAQDMSLSDSLDLAAVQEKNGLEIIPLAGNTDDYARLLPPNPQNIQKITWYSDGHHLFLSYPDKTIFLDTGDTRLEHLYEVGAVNAKYMPQTNELYFLEGNLLKKLVFPS